MKEILLKDIEDEIFYLPCGTLIKSEKDFFLIVQLHVCSFVKVNHFFYHSIGQIKIVIFSQNKKPLFFVDARYLKIDNTRIFLP